MIGTSADGQSASSLSARTRGFGNAENLTIQTKQLNIQDKAQVSTRSSGLANAGVIQINTSSIKLDKGGSIIATTTSGEGGNVFLHSQNIQLHSGSSIATDATGGTGNGGNITINTDLLSVFNNSSITAKAVEGRGGNIQINTQGFFRSPDSSITASSQQGINGIVQFNGTIIDPTSSLLELPSQLIEPSALIAQSCPVDTDPNGNSFVITGRGGLPDSPYQPFKDRSLWVDLRSLGKNQSLQQSRTKISTPNIQSNLDRSEPDALVEANTWIVNSQGEVVLAAAIPDVGIDVPWLSPTSCTGARF